jgi:asparagine synthase (glutamine-hydrolysing)
VCRAARRQVTVALCGDGGDEVFGGYDRYRAMSLGETMGPARFTAVRLAAWLARPWVGQGERSLPRRLIRFSQGLTLPPALQYLKYRALFDPGDLSRLATEEFLATTGEDAAAEWFCELYENQDAPDELTRAQRHDLETYLPDDLLVKADIASMASSLELRAPMLDHDLVGVGLSLPAEMKFDGRIGKAALREAFSDLLPAELLRQRKRGFGVPLGRWLRVELRETLLETLTDPDFLAKRIVRPEAVVGLMNDHFSGRADHSHRLWALLMLGRWLARQS